MRRVALLLVLLLAVGVGVEEYVVGAGRAYVQQRWLGPDPLTEPAAVPLPPGLSLAPLPSVAPVAEPAAETGLIRGSKVRRAIEPWVGDPDLGPRVAVGVDSLDGRRVLRSGPARLMPASTTKLLTAAAALSVLGPEHVFHTRVVANDSGKRIFLVGGGDPYLASRPQKPGDQSYPGRADVVTLAKAAAVELKERGVRRVRLSYDATLFTGPTASPGWPDDYIADHVVSPISALWVDDGREKDGFHRSPNPPQRAADLFGRALAKAGIVVRGPIDAAAAPTAGSEMAVATSAPLAQIVEHFLDVSGNEAAEVVAHQVGLATMGEGSFAAGAQGVERTLATLGVDVARLRLLDGSGLSRHNRIRVDTLLDVLRVSASADHPELRAVITGLPVAAYTGSLADRFSEVPMVARGLVRAKTGTLTGVSALAGLATDRNGTTMLFVVGADRVAVEDTLGARDALDHVTAALARCSCG